MAFLKSIENLRQVDWGKSYMWDLRFTEATGSNHLSTLTGTQFSEWFPAMSVDENKATVNSQALPGPHSDFMIPKNSSAFQISVGFADDSDYTILNWLDTWMNKDILHNGEYMSTLQESVKIIHIAKLQPKKGAFGANLLRLGVSSLPAPRIPVGIGSIGGIDAGALLVGAASKFLPQAERGDTVATDSYYVYPEGSLNYIGSSNSDVPIYTMKFNIVGKLKATGEGLLTSGQEKTLFGQVAGQLDKFSPNNIKSKVLGFKNKAFG